MTVPIPDGSILDLMDKVDGVLLRAEPYDGPDYL